MLKKVTQFIDKYELIKNGDRLVIGVSGGPDSIALLHVLWKMKDQYNLSLVVAHVDHMLRGKESNEDFLYVEKICSSLHIPFEGTQIDVAAYKKKHHMSTQEAARECRYQFFKTVMDQYQYDKLVLAHHGDDQVETMLMRLVRGSFVSGLAGIPVKRAFAGGEIIRPFLRLSKAEIEEYCQQEGLKPRLDSSNLKDDYVRNRLRHHVLPYLKRENPKIHERVQYISEVLQQEDQLLEQLTEEAVTSVITEKKKTEITFSIPRLQSLPFPLQRRGIHLILKYLYKEKISYIQSIHIEKVLSLLAGEHPSSRVDLPLGLQALRSYHICKLTFHPPHVESYHYTLKVPGHIDLPGGYRITATILDEFPQGKTNRNFFVCDPNNITLPIVVRTRQPGDRMTIKGMNGTKKVKDIFIDSKVPRERRDHWPIVLDSDDRLLWLPGLKKSSYATSENNLSKYILLEYTTY